MKIAEILNEGKAKDLTKLKLKDLIAVASNTEELKSRGMEFLSSIFAEKSGSNKYEYFFLVKLGSGHGFDPTTPFAINHMTIVEDPSAPNGYKSALDGFTGVVLTGLTKEDGKKILNALPGIKFKDFMQKGRAYSKFYNELMKKAGTGIKLKK